MLWFTKARLNRKTDSLELEVEKLKIQIDGLMLKMDTMQQKFISLRGTVYRKRAIEEEDEELEQENGNPFNRVMVKI